MPARFAFALAVICFVGPAQSNAAVTPSPSPTMVRSIGMTVNGQTLQGDTHPLVIEGRVYVPLRPVFEAVGLTIERDGPRLGTTLPNGPLEITVGSTQAIINGRPATLDGTVVDIKGTAYVPLRFLTQSIGAVAIYDQREARVDITSGYIGKNVGPVRPIPGGGTTVVGVVSALETSGAPATITVVASGVPHTIAITSTAAIYIEDSTIRSQIRGQLSDIRVGDALRAVLAKNGDVLELHAFYASTSGKIAAVSPSSFVLQGGKVITPERDTEITLNAASAAVGDLKVGDDVTVRSNPDSGALRQIVVSRPVAQSTQTANLSIASFKAVLSRPLHAGESFSVALQGTPGARATFDLGDIVTGIAMREDSPGNYSGSYTIPDRFNVADLPIYGHLSSGSVNATRVESPIRLSTATTPPQITEVAPPPGESINNRRPNIYATFFVPSEIGIDPSSIVVSVNGHDESPAATRTKSFVTYSPGVDLPAGQVTVTVRVRDLAGNVGSRSWTFYIR